jgi:hypothetical protein
MRARRELFTTVHTEGAVLPPDLLARVVAGDPSLPGLEPETYHLDRGDRLKEAITRSWNRLLGTWRAFQEQLSRLPETDRATTLTRERWLLPLFAELGYGWLAPARAVELDGKSYAISHAWGAVPIHLLGWRTDLDRREKGVAGAAAQSPHGLLQELLNRSGDRLYGFVSNGRVLRLLRDNTSLTRQAYVQFDLEAMFSGEVHADFVLLWLVCHVSRLEGEPPETCILERWREAAREQGVRALEALRNGVQRAIEALGTGFLAHPANAALREALRRGALDRQDYYRELLRLVYRLIFLFVAEDREVLFDPASPAEARERYLRYYSTARLRDLAARRRGTRHGDLWEGLKVVMRALAAGAGAPGLALPALGSFLWSPEAIPHLEAAQLSNEHLLSAVRSLSEVTESGVRRAVDYRNLGTEELGSVYESLLELHPEVNLDAATFELKVEAGHERKATGSYYTPPQLVQCLLDTALEPVLAERARAPDPEAAILSLKVLDPASGSGHFLVAAAHRIARRLAAVRTGDAEPSPEAVRKALRDVVSRCIYAVDVNEMAVELCKVSLWLEALDPGRPLSFLDAHVKRGNSLLGVTPALLARGIPDAAYKEAHALDDKEACRALGKRNRAERSLLASGARQTMLEEWATAQSRELVKAIQRLAGISDDTSETVAAKEEVFREIVEGDAYRRAKLAADTWCAAFFLPKRKGSDGITTDTVRRLLESPDSVPEALKQEVERVASELAFFHWHLEFPEVFRVGNGEPENPEAGWSGGFDVVLGNPPWERVKLEEKQFFAARAPEVAVSRTKAERHRAIEKLREDDPALYRAYQEALHRADSELGFLHGSGRYPLCGRGDTNTYAVFAETFRTLLAPAGRAGMVVPTGIATDATTQHFFADVVERRQLASLYDFENRKGLFPGVDRRYKFCLLTLTGRRASRRRRSSPSSATSPRTCRIESAASRSRPRTCVWSTPTPGPRPSSEAGGTPSSPSTSTAACRSWWRRERARRAIPGEWSSCGCSTWRTTPTSSVPGKSSRPKASACRGTSSFAAPSGTFPSTRPRWSTSSTTASATTGPAAGSKDTQLPRCRLSAWWTRTTWSCPATGCRARRWRRALPPKAGTAAGSWAGGTSPTSPTSAPSSPPSSQGWGGDTLPLAFRFQSSPWASQQRSTPYRRISPGARRSAEPT